MNTIGSIIAKYRRIRKMSQPTLARSLIARGFRASAPTICNWEKGTANPGADTLMEVCRILEIPDIIEEYFGCNPQNPLSPLDDEGRAKARELIQLLVDTGRYRRIARVLTADAAVYKTIWDYEDAASAGAGEMLGEGRREKIKVKNAPTGTDFSVRIHGDSMMPDFKNGQRVFVHQQPILDNGEIGIFGLNGDAFIKKLHTDENGTFLVSLNSAKYDPIPVTVNDEFRVFGKVLGIAVDFTKV